MKTKIPNIIIFLIVGVLIMAGVWFYFRTKEKIDEKKKDEAGNFFTNLFKSSEN